VVIANKPIAYGHQPEIAAQDSARSPISAMIAFLASAYSFMSSHSRRTSNHLTAS
jgi:hypothetical protein